MNVGGGVFDKTAKRFWHYLTLMTLPPLMKSPETVIKKTLEIL